MDALKVLKETTRHKVKQIFFKYISFRKKTTLLFRKKTTEIGINWEKKNVTSSWKANNQERYSSDSPTTGLNDGKKIPTSVMN